MMYFGVLVLMVHIVIIQAKYYSLSKYCRFRLKLAKISYMEPK